MNHRSTAEANGSSRRPASPTWLSRGRIPGLDGLRAVSILLVLASHMAQGNQLPGSHFLLDTLDLGHIGVQIFFGISGFLITLLLLRELSRTGVLDLKGFYVRRALRILPVYIAFVIVVVILNYLKFFRLAERDWVAMLTYTANVVDGKTGAIAHLWSLSLEEQFYLAWPPILALLGVVRARRVLLGYLVAAPVLRVLASHFLHHLQALRWTSPLDAEGVVMGCLLALVVTDSGWRERLRWLNRPSPLLGMAAFTVLFASFALAMKSALFGLLFNEVVSAAAVVVILWTTANDTSGPIGRLLNSGPVRLIGVLSYSIYIWQQLLFVCTPRLTIGPVHLDVILAVLAGAASYTFIESPFLRLKERFAHSDTQTLVAPAETPVPAIATGVPLP